MVKLQDIDIPYLEFGEAAAPGTPAAAVSRIYVKADGLFYSKDDAGVETLMSGGSGGAVATDAIWDAKGDLAGGTGANTAAKLTVGTNGTILTADSGETTGMKWAAAGSGGIASGTSFPGSPSDNDIFYRSDRDILYFYNGTRWLTVNLYMHPMTWIGEAAAVFPQSAAQTPFRTPVPFGNAYDVWLESMVWLSRVITTNNGSQYWTVALAKLTIAGASTTIVTGDTSADTAGQFPVHTTTINALLGTSHTMLDINTAKVTTPGNLAALEVHLLYRLVG